MITTPTVLFLGAGASAPYGFPTGPGLRDRILDGFSSRDAPGAFGWWHNACWAAFKEAGVADAVRRLQTELRTSGHRSIDAFLERQSPEVVAAGKMAIAAALLPIEGNGRLFPPNAPAREHWYEDLVQRLSIDDPADFLKNRLSVVTLNYDRSFEHYLHAVLYRRLLPHVAESSIWKYVEHIPVIHLHGSLGPLYGPKALVKFGECASIQREGALRAAAQHIQVIHEAKPRSAEFVTARRLLKAAQQVYFLGFGYHKDTVQRLGRFVKDPNDFGPKRIRVAGTAKGISPRDWEHICTNVFAGAFSDTRRYSMSVARFMREVAQL